MYVHRVGFRRGEQLQSIWQQDRQPSGGAVILRLLCLNLNLKKDHMLNEWERDWRLFCGHSAQCDYVWSPVMSLSEQGRSPTGSNAHTASTGKILESDRRSCLVQKVASSYVSGSVRLKRGSVEQRGYFRDRRGSNFTELNCVYRQIEGYRRKKKNRTLGFPKQRLNAASPLVMTNAISSHCFHIWNSCLKACSDATPCHRTASLLPAHYCMI